MAGGFFTELWSRPKADDKNKWSAYFYSESYFSNFVIRMLPHAFAYVPMFGAWIMMIK